MWVVDELLVDHGGVAPPDRRFEEVGSVPGQGAGVHLLQAGKGTQQRRLSRHGPADDSVEPSRFKDCGHALEMVDAIDGQAQISGTQGHRTAPDRLPFDR